MFGGSGDSSSPVVDISPPSNIDIAEQNEGDSLTEETRLTGKTELHEKSSSSKGLGFIKKRAKSPFRSPLKTHLKSPFKHSKSSKSQQKSPTKEIPQEDIEKIEKSINEKKSEEWQVFQQMQERIKQNVIKTQSSLNKFSGNEGKDKSESKTEQESWSSDDEKSSLIPTDSTQNQSQDTRQSSYTMEKEQSDITSSNAEADLLGLGEDFSHLIPSPRVPPKPPQNSLRSSMENLLDDNPPGDVHVTTGAGSTFVLEDDLLGLGCETQNAPGADAGAVVSCDNVINEDLLGLDNIISSTDSQYGSSLHSSFDGSEFMYGATSQSERSSQLSTPLGFDNWEDNPNIHVGTLSSTFVSSMVDEFLQLDTMKDVKHSDLNPFDSSQSQINKRISGIDDFDPFSSKLATSSTNSQPFDGFSNLNVKPAERKAENIVCGDDTDADLDMGIVTFCRDYTESSKEVDPYSVYDNFGFGSIDQGGGKPDVNESEKRADNRMASLVNPFLDPPIVTSEPAKSTEDTVHFEEDFFQARGSSAAATSDVWGVPASEDDVHFSSNPFQDDFFDSDAIVDHGASAFFGKDTTGLEESDPEGESSSKNPFLQGDIGDFQPSQTNVNAFLDFPVAEAPQPSETMDAFDSFLLDKSENVKTEGAKVSSLDEFDPFGMASKVDHTQNQDAETDDFTAAALACDNQLVDPDDLEDKETFKLEIKPAKPTSLNTSSIPPPALKPPPRPPKSPQPPRINPFDKESLTEDKFEAPEFEESEGTKSIKSSCDLPSLSMSEECTPEEELKKLEPLEPFYPVEDRDCWAMMLRHPTKKKLTTNRSWKQVFVRLGKASDGPVIKLYFNKDDKEPFQELPIQPCYSLSDIALQHYDQYGKIYTIKLQYIFYKERVGIRPDRITPSFVKKPKATMILDHAPQVSELMKFGSLDKADILSFVREVEDALMKIEAHREKTLTYVKDEVSAEVWDEYKAVLNKQGKMVTQKARVRIFFLAFVTGMPTCELGINDKRRRGMEVVGRHDIIPIKTEEWIRLENVEFHCSVNTAEFEKTNNIKFRPLDACQFELLRYRVRLRENKELPLQLKVDQTLKESRFEIRCDLLVTGYHSFSKKHGQFPCEDIEVRFPIPEQWIYLFRYEKRFGYGSFKSAVRKPGKIKGLERLTMIAQGLLTPTLMEADVGVAKYEHLYRCVVWRIPRLPERNEGAYKNHIFRMALDLGPHDDVPKTFEKFADVEFTMPSCTVSQTQVRSISVENPNPPDKWVRYIAKYQYRIEIDFVNELEKKEKPKDEVHLKETEGDQENLKEDIASNKIESSSDDSD